MIIRKKHICILADDYPSDYNPAMFVFVEQLVNAWIDMDIGVKISVVASQSLTRCLFRHVPVLPKKQTYYTFGNRPYEVYRPYSISFGNGRKWLYRLTGWFSQYGVNRSLKKINPDVLYGHFWHQANRLKGYALKNHKPLFVACGEGDDALESLVAGLSSKEKDRLAKAISGVISVSEENRRKSVEYGLVSDENVAVFPNAVNTALFYPRRRNIELRTLLGVTDEDFLLLFVGSFIPRKGSGMLARAIQKANDPHIKVIFAGRLFKGDEDDPQCDGIVFKGLVPHDELPAYYACADAFVLPTLKEGCSNAIVEALAMGLPVISSDRAFNDDILNDNNSIRIDPTNVNEITLAILELKNDRVYYQQMKKNVLSAACSHSIFERVRKIDDFINIKIGTEAHFKNS